MDQAARDGVRAELAALKRLCGVPPEATLRQLPDGLIAFARADREGVTYSVVPPTVVVDYLAGRVAALLEEIATVRARRADAVRIIERQRDELRRLRARLREVTLLFGGHDGDAVDG